MTKRFLPYWGDRWAGAESTMFCLPHLGGGASAFYEWTKERGSPAVQPVQLPGREDLFHLPLVDDMNQLVERLGVEIGEAARRPFVLFGHSMGAAIAAELTAWLHRTGAVLPELLVVSAAAPVPAITERERRRGSVGTLADEEIIAEIMAMGGTSEEILGDGELRELVLEVVRSDLRMMENYRPTFAKLPVPLLVLGGAADDTVTTRELSLWREHTDLGWRAHTLPGGHFYLREQIKEVLALVAGALSGLPQAVSSER
ncbi:thioesterase II family protein [Amycolatopsis sp. NPDC058340]|uniref:thioesterase II family protein n=1 Tax=Amycolatopsis sp. NPDC058340 TaxID=3346453 RepID=UPI0036524247